MSQEGSTTLTVSGSLERVRYSGKSHVSVMKCVISFKSKRIVVDSESATKRAARPPYATSVSVSCEKHVSVSRRAEQERAHFLSNRRFNRIVDKEPHALKQTPTTSRRIRHPCRTRRERSRERERPRKNNKFSTRRIKMQHHDFRLMQTEASGMMVNAIQLECRQQQIQVEKS